MEVELVDKPDETRTYIGECGGEDKLVYPGVDSCLTVSGVLEDGSLTGVHLVRIGEDEDAENYKARLEQWEAITKRKGRLAKVILAGELDCWRGEQGEIIAEITSLIENKFSADVQVEERRLVGKITVDSKGGAYAASDK